MRLGRYELITRIGQGGMAEVQLALQRGPAGFEKLVVVKLVHDTLATQKAFVDMLLDEARVAALVKHPERRRHLRPRAGRRPLLHRDGVPRGRAAARGAARRARGQAARSAVDRAADRRHRRGARRRARAAQHGRRAARARPPRRLARQHRRALQRPGEARRFRRREGDASRAGAGRPRSRASSATWRPRSCGARRAIAAATSSRSAA